MTAFTPARAFYAPQIHIHLNGRKLGREVLLDIIDVTYTDDEVNLDSFDFSLGDWDPVERRSKYSSPWDASGRHYQIGGQNAPNFEPGAAVELYLAYQGEGDPVLMMKGEVISITPSFPAAGAPTCRVRAVNSLNRLEREQITDTLTGTKMGIARQIARLAGVDNVDLPPDADTGEETTDALNNAVAYGEILKRARDSGLVMWLDDDEGESVLRFARPTADTPVAELVWGVNLVSFAPQMSVRGVVETVVVRGTDPAQAGDAQAIEVSAGWSDVGADENALGPQGMVELKRSVAGTTETITDAEVRNEQEAQKKARDRLSAILNGIVTASGSAIGMPELRAGRVIEIGGLGPRFSGKYRIRQTSHSLGASGYTVTFQARKVVLQ